MPTIEIGCRQIGDGRPVYIIAELSANHNGSFDRAVALIEAAAEAGADAVKMQTYTADTLTLDCDRDPFLIGDGTPWKGRTLYELYSQAYTPWEWQPKLKEKAESLGLECFSSPFDISSVDFLDSIGVKAFKIASFELVDIPLIEYAASKGKAMIISTGMGTKDEIREAVDTVSGTGNRNLALLKCVSAYPAGVEDMNLATIPDLANEYGVVSGLSDHTLTTVTAVTSVALGSKIVEKHITLARKEGGCDAGFSLEPNEFRDMVDAVRTAESAIGKINYAVTPGELASRAFRRSLFAVTDIQAGEEFTAKNIRSIRPSDGISPKYYGSILGARAKTHIERGMPLDWSMIDSNHC